MKDTQLADLARGRCVRVMAKNNELYGELLSYLTRNKLKIRDDIVKYSEQGLLSFEWDFIYEDGLSEDLKKVLVEDYPNYYDLLEVAFNETIGAGFGLTLNRVKGSDYRVSMTIKW